MDRLELVIADDHPLFRKGVRDTLGAEPSFAIVAEAGDGVTALQLIEQYAPAVAVLDIDMPGMSGIEVLQAVRARELATAIVLLTMHDGADLLHHALGLGALGYLLKENAADDLISCVFYVSAGKPYVTPSMSQHLIRSTVKTAGGSPFTALTPTELRIVRLVAEAKSSKAIASALGLSVKTVENHRSNACAKLGVRGSNALLKFLLEHKPPAA